MHVTTACHYGMYMRKTAQPPMPTTIGGNCLNLILMLTFNCIKRDNGSELLLPYFLNKKVIDQPIAATPLLNELQLLRSRSAYVRF